MRQEWDSFRGGVWEKEINVRDFIQKNYTPYDGDDSFLAGPTETTKELWAQVMELSEEERMKGGVLDMDTHIISTITHTAPDIWIKIKKRSWDFRQTSRSSARCSPTAVSAWRSKPARENGYHVDPEIVEFLQNTVKPTTTAYLTLTHRRCAPAVPAISSPDFRTPTAADVSSATTDGLPFMAWTG